MKYALDSSVSLAWVLPNPLAAKARKLREDFRKAIHECIAPDVFIGEDANALIKSERQKIIPVGHGPTLLLEIMSTPPVLYPFPPLVSKAMAVASQTRAGSFDCLYVMLAEREQCEFVTTDDRLVKHLQPQYPFVRHLSTF